MNFRLNDVLSSRPNFHKTISVGIEVRDAAGILPECEIGDYKEWFDGFCELFRYVFLYKERGGWVGPFAEMIRKDWEEKG